MRLGSLTLSVTLSAALLSGCSFITGQPSQYKNPFAAQQAGHSGQYGQAAAGQNCQIATPRQPIPRGCRPEQVTIGLAQQSQAFGGQNFGSNGFPQQPQFGQPQYTNGAYGSAVGQTAALSYHTPKAKKRKPKLRGSLSLGVERSVGGELIDYSIRDDDNLASGYNPQTFIEGFETGTEADGLIVSTYYTANNVEAQPGEIYDPNEYDSLRAASISFDDAWSTPAQIKGGLEYIVNNKMTVFANAGYTYAEGNAGDVATVEATVYNQVIEQPYDALLQPDGAPLISTTFIPNQEIATFAYDFSDLRQYDLEVGARHYFDPLVKSEGYRTVTPFVGASVGVSHVNAVDVSVSQRQASYGSFFNTASDPSFYDVPTSGGSTRLYDSQWLPQAQLNLGAEWQVTPGFAIAAETGVKVQGAREYADFTNAASETVSGAKGDANISVPVSLRGSINF